MESLRERALAKVEELEATLEQVRSADVRELLIALRNEELQRIAALDRACAPAASVIPECSSLGVAPIEALPQQPEGAPARA